jgi:hypothetical protein
MSEMSRAGINAAPEIEEVECEAWLDLFAAAPADYAAAAGLTYKRIARAGALAHQAVPITEFNRVLAPGIRSSWTASEFEDAADWLQRHAAKGWAIQISPAAQPSEINEWATRHGLEPTGAGWAKWHQAASTTMSRPSESDLKVKVVGQDYGDVFGSVVQQGFGLPESTRPWFAALPGRPGWRTYLAFDGRQAVAAGAMFINGRWAWLGVDATLAEARRRGAQNAIIAQRLLDGVANGVLSFAAETANPPAGEDASYSSFRNYGKAGFSLAYVRPNFKLRQPG